MPQIGLGVYLISDIAVCESSVQSALETGYRLIDTAIAYRNERAVGRGLRASAVPREEIFLTTKLWPSHYKYDKARVAIAESVKRLDSGYIDLLLLHQPVGDIHGAWRAMEEAWMREQSAPSASATSPWPTWTICFRRARITPVLDQVELHPYWQQPELLPHLSSHSIVAEAWYPLGHGSKSLLAEPAVLAAATEHGKSPVQIILRWHVQRGFVAIPKSTDPEHIAANIDVFDFELAAAEMSAINAVGRDRPMFRMPRWAMAATMPLARPRQRA